MSVLTPTTMPDGINQDVAVAYAALAGKLHAYNARFGYYDGDHPIVYTRDALRDVFRSLDADFHANWCALVIDSVADRINLAGFSAAKVSAQKKLMAAYNDLDLNLESDDAHRAALICGEAFIVAWKDEKGVIDAYYNDPRLCHVFYDPERPKRVAWAAKWWVDDDGYRRLTLYYPDRLEYYISQAKSENVTSAASFRPWAEMDRAPNPFGVVPVFHLRPDRRAIRSDLTDVIPLQNGINKLMLDMMVAAEYGAFKQRYIVSNADVAELKNRPNEVWQIPAAEAGEEGTRVGEFSPTDLDNYLKAMDRLANIVGAISRTPKHYFLATGGDPSGEALLSMESPLVKKVRDRIDRFIPTWQQFGAFLLSLYGLTVQPADITPVFDDPRTVQPYTQAQTRKIERESGIPLKTLLRREGWTDAELDQLAQDQQAATPAALVPAAAASTEDSPL